MNFSISLIYYFPFIHKSASNYNTVYITLLYALDDSKYYRHDVRFIFFDQFPYAKAREIVSSAPG